MNGTKLQRFGFYTAVLVVLLNAGFTVTLIMFPTPAWISIEHYNDAFDQVQMVPMAFAFALAVAVLVLFVIVRRTKESEKTIFGDIGLALILLYVPLVCLNYFLQMTVVTGNALANNLDQYLELIVMANPASITLSMDILGYLFLSMGALFFAAQFGGKSMNEAIRYALLATGIMGVIGVIGYMLDHEGLGFLLMISGAIFLVACALIALRFRSLGKVMEKVPG